MAIRAAKRAEYNDVLAKRYTRRDNSGVLSSTRGIRDILRENLTQSEYRRSPTPIAFFSSAKYVVYLRELLGNPDIDERIAKAKACVAGIGGFTVCHPETLLMVRKFKADPYYRAKALGMGSTIRRLMATKLPAVERFMWLCVLNHASGIDEYTGLDTYQKILQLLSRLTPDVNGYSGVLERLWHVPRSETMSEDNLAMFHCFMYVLNDAGGDEKVNYEDIEFVKVLNELLRANNLEPVKKIGEPLRPWPQLF